MPRYLVITSRFQQIRGWHKSVVPDKRAVDFPHAKMPARLSIQSRVTHYNGGKSKSLYDALRLHRGLRLPDSIEV